MKRLLIFASCLLMLVCHSPAAVPGGDLLGGLIMKQFDLNSDGILDSGEWQNGTGGSFSEMDDNGDGSLAGGDIDALSDEISGETGELGAAVVVLLVKQVVLTLDKDDDQLVSKAEFDSGCEAIFRKLDADINGEVSQSELATLPARLLKSA